jgi:hypothetical protein
LYDTPQIRLNELLFSVSYDDIQELWEVSRITSTPENPCRPHYIIILNDSTILCTCMQIVNQGMLCRHQYRILIQSSKAIFHLSFIHSRWFESIPSETMNITIINGKTNYEAIPLRYISQIRYDNVYTPAVREHVNKKAQYGTTMSLAKTGIQIAIAEGVTAELIGTLMQFIMKYRNNTGFGTNLTNLEQNNVLRELFTNTEVYNR